MKLLWIVFDEAFEDQVLETLKKEGIHHFTLMRGAIGQGANSEPRWGTHVWPGHNDALWIYLSDEDLARITPTLQKLKESLKGRGFKAIVWDAREV